MPGATPPSARASRPRPAANSATRSARIADLETALARATQQAAAARPARAQETEKAPADAASRDVDDDSPRGVVEAIRRARLVDVDLSSCPAAVRAGARGLQASLAAAAERLAGDLYEHRAHFVHELVQNADDAKYANDADRELPQAARE